MCGLCVHECSYLWRLQTLNLSGVTGGCEPTEIQVLWKNRNTLNPWPITLGPQEERFFFFKAYLFCGKNWSEHLELWCRMDARLVVVNRGVFPRCIGRVTLHISFCCCNTITSGIVFPQKRKGYLGLQFGRFQSMIDWQHTSGPVVRQQMMAENEWWTQAAPVMLVCLETNRKRETSILRSSPRVCLQWGKHFREVPAS